MILIRKNTVKNNRTDNFIQPPTETEFLELNREVGRFHQLITISQNLDIQIAKHENAIKAGNLSLDDLKTNIMECQMIDSQLYGLDLKPNLFKPTPGLLSSNITMLDYESGLLGLKDWFVKAKDSVVKFFKTIWNKIKELWNKIFGSKANEKATDQAQQAVDQVNAEIASANPQDKENAINKAVEEEANKAESMDPIEAAKQLAIFNLTLLNSGFERTVTALLDELNEVEAYRSELTAKMKEVRIQAKAKPDNQELQKKLASMQAELASLKVKLDYRKEEYEHNASVFEGQKRVEEKLANLYKECMQAGLAVTSLGFEADIDGIGDPARAAVFIPFTSKPFLIFKSNDGKFHLKATHFKLKFVNKQTFLGKLKSNISLILNGDKTEKDIIRKRLRMDKLMSLLQSKASELQNKSSKTEKSLEESINKLAGPDATDHERKAMLALAKLHAHGLLEISTTISGIGKLGSTIANTFNGICSKVSTYLNKDKKQPEQNQDGN